MLLNSTTYYQISSISGYAASVKEMVIFLTSLPIQERMKHSGSYLYSCLTAKRLVGIIHVSGATGKVSIKSFHRFNIKTGSWDGNISGIFVILQRLKTYKYRALGMGNYEENRKLKEEVKKKNDLRKEKIAGYFFDLSKLSFAGMVIGSITPLFTDVNHGFNWYSTILGVITTYVFAFFANRILK